MSVLAPERVDEDSLEIPLERRGSTLGTCLRWLLAACSLGAAVLHFAFTPSHYQEYWLYGLFFVVVAWMQLLWALGVVLRPWRSLLVASGAVNSAVIVVYVLSRTVGVWVGPNATVSETVGFPDVLATVLEALIVVGSLVLLANPRLLTRRFQARWLAPVAASSAIVLIAGSAGYAVTPRFASAHVHDHSVAGLTGKTPCEQAGPPVSQGQVVDSGGHFHRGPTVQQPIDEATRLQLQSQQEMARTVVARYPTVADAERAGYRMSTPYVPCIGAHYTNTALARQFDPAAPSELLYDSTVPNGHIVGLSYLVYHPGGPPEGFAGPNDVWHQHTFNGGLCINANQVVVGAESTSPAQCAALGGTKVALTDIWMLHDWVVPGFECSWGVFAPECPELGGRIGGTPWDPPNPNGGPLAQG